MRYSIFTFSTDEGIRPDVLGRAVEERGFDALFLAEHSHLPVGATIGPDGKTPLDRVYYRSLDPFLALTAAATVTSRIELGTGIALLPQRDLIHTAKEVATLDRLSGGRVILGVGAGWNRAEMRDHGTDPSTRGKLLDEQLEALEVIWNNEQAEFHGRFIDFDPIYQWPKPVQLPRPPIYIGGHSEAAVNRLLERGDGWMPVDASPEKVREVREALNARGRHDVAINTTEMDRLEEYREAGADRATLYLATMSESDTLRKLDEYAERFLG